MDSSIACFGNFLISHLRTSTWPTLGALLIWTRSLVESGRCRVIFEAPSLHTEQIALRFEGSSVPPNDLSMICPICNLAFLPSEGCMSPAAIPHIWQVKPFLSKTKARVSLDIFLPNEGSSFVSIKTYCPGFKLLRSLWVTIFIPSSFLNSLILLAHSLEPATFLSLLESSVLPTFAKKNSLSFAFEPSDFFFMCIPLVF